jgi:hypothetical protein
VPTLLRWLSAIVLATGPALADAAECSAASGARRVPLLELYTSEGCDSCPPADRWIIGLPARGLAQDRVIALAFHVDYWNYLGWTDPYAKPEFGERQRSAARRNAARMVYTPQLLLNGKDFRRAMLRDDFADRVAAINREGLLATISLKINSPTERMLIASGETRVQQIAGRAGASTYLALYENRLANRVLAGENRGRRLEHAAVVRELAGPFTLDAQGAARFDHGFQLDPTWKRGDLNVAAFVQSESSGEVLQALALGCAPR